MCAGPKIAQPNMPHQKIPRTRAARVANAIPRPEDSDDDDHDSEYWRDTDSQVDNNVFEPLFSLFGALAQGCQPNQGFRRSARPSSQLDEDEEQLRRQARQRAMARVGMRQKTNIPFSSPADFVPPCRVTSDGQKEWSF